MTPDGLTRHWLREQALPLWATAGIDADYGGFTERLGPDGTPDFAAPKRLRVQARQIYVYSHARFLGWWPDLEPARTGLRFIQTCFRHADGGWITSVQRDGTPADTSREAYDHAFILLAMAWFLKAGGGDAARQVIGECWRFVERQLMAPPPGGFLDARPDPGRRRQNPHMHMLEAVLALHDATGDAYWRRQADALVDLFGEYFFDPRTATLGEFFDAQLRPAAGAAGQIVEPGHHWEWVWLLYRYGRLTGRMPARPIRALAGFAAAHGVDPDDGLTVDRVRRDGTGRSDGKRLWAQTEALRALVALHETGLDPAAGKRLAPLAATLFHHYLDGLGGRWLDQPAVCPARAAQYAPASSFYHVFAALAEIQRTGGGR